MNELVLAQVIPKNLIVDTADLVENFHKALLPYRIKPGDIREIINQITDLFLKDDIKSIIPELRRLPAFDRIVSKHFLDTIECQHLLKAATFELGCELFLRLERLGAFQSYQFKGKFPYALEGMVGNDTLFFHLPF